MPPTLDTETRQAASLQDWNRRIWIATIDMPKAYQRPTITLPTPTMVGVGREMGRSWLGVDKDLVPPKD